LYQIFVEKLQIIIKNRRKILKQISAFFVLFIFLFTACNNGQSASKDELNWENNLEQAIAQAKKENKAVLVNFTGSDWCIWCKKLSSEVFQQEAFKNYADDNLVLVMLDFPRNIQQSAETQAYNRNLAQRYGIQGFPTILIFDSQGKMVAQTGYQPGGPEKYIEHIKSYL